MGNHSKCARCGELDEYCVCKPATQQADSFRDHLQRCSDKVATWPDWKRAPAPSREAAQQPDPDDPITLLKRMSEQASALLHWLEQITPGRRWVGTILQGHIDRTATALKETVDAAAQLRAAQPPDLTALRRLAAGEDDEFNAALNECIWGATDETIAGLFGVLERALNPEAK
jgi:hypothetical protein